MRDAVIASAVRTPAGKAPKGTLRTTRPDELAAVTIREALRRAEGIEPETWTTSSSAVRCPRPSRG